MKFGKVRDASLVQHANIYQLGKQYEDLSRRMTFAEKRRILLSSLMIGVYLGLMLSDLLHLSRVAQSRNLA